MTAKCEDRDMTMEQQQQQQQPQRRQRRRRTRKNLDRLLVTSAAAITIAAAATTSSSLCSAFTNTNAALLPALHHRVQRRVAALSVLKAANHQRDDPTIGLLESGTELTNSKSTSSNSSSKREGDEGATPVSTNNNNHDPTSPLGMICDSQREYEMQLGKAVDTLRKDYPDLLTENPDFSIYHDDIEVVDPTGVSLHGLRNYKTSFRFIHAVVHFFYCPEKSGLTFRLVYDWARKSIRVSWNAILVPKRLYGGYKNKLHVDGISEYDIDRSSGLITTHRVTHLLINDAHVRPVKGIFHALAEISPEPDGIPVLSSEFKSTLVSGGGEVGVGGGGGNFVSEFRPPSSNPFASLFNRPTSSSLFSASDDNLFDQEAFERKNASRRKFGLKPLTPEEYVQIEAEVRKLDRAQKQKASALSAAAEINGGKERNNKGGIFGKFFEDVMKDQCTSNFDCERPEVCCDFGFKKVCCSSGLGIIDGVPAERYRERATVPVTAAPPPGQQEPGVSY